MSVEHFRAITASGATVGTLRSAYWMAARLAMSQGHRRTYAAFSKQHFPKVSPLHPATLPLIGRGLPSS
ncbi:hypothetical protein RR48_13425 [Papilio machaon]|uniref:Uncharacterized protein n=1 Tax=Papilio machaon TaxID=76193 RepID=A0A194R1R2_PAPMA|nr:hypothetical protein RR48_13425 [Papilio machaon]